MNLINTIIKDEQKYGNFSDFNLQITAQTKELATKLVTDPSFMGGEKIF